MERSAGFTVPPQPDVRLVDALALPTIVRRLTADLANRQLQPEAAAFVVVHLPFVGREAVAMALLRGDADAAVKMLRAVAI